MHFLPDISFLLHFAPLLIGLWSNSGGNSSNPQTTTNTLTSSGPNSPPIIGGGTSSSTSSVASGSIGVTGAGAKYQEAGARDYSGANVGGVGGNLNASGGATITIGDPNAVDALGQIAQQLAGAVAGGGGSGGGGSVIVPGGGGTSILPSLTQNINWSLVAIVGAVLLGIWILFGRKKK